MADYTKIIELHPDNAKAYNYRGRSKGCLKRYEEAIADYDNALRLDPSYIEVLELKREAENPSWPCCVQ